MGSRSGGRALNDPSVLAFIGPLDSGAAQVAIPILCRANLVMVTPGASRTGLTRPAATSPNEPDVYYPNGCKCNFARLVPADDREGATSADWAR